MNPNKKKPDPKNNSPWLLCPSKSFPGKFYYFNGSTGETAWCLSETDKNLKKDTIHRVADKTHSYPEPFDPPIDDSTNTTNSFISLKNAGNSAFDHNTNEIGPSHVFGQAVFPKYVSPDYFPPKYVWTLTPMCLPSQLPQRQMMDEMTPTHKQPMFVPNVTNPFQLLNGFQYQNQPFQFKERPMFEHTSKFNSSKLSKEAQTLARPPMKDEACQTFVPIRAKGRSTQSESSSTTKSVASRSVENLTTLTKVAETSTLSTSDKVNNETGKLSELAKNDLRLKLIAKKRKVGTVESEKMENSADQSTSKTREATKLKKHVNFVDVRESSASHTSSKDVKDIDQFFQSPESSQMEDVSQPPPVGPWYVVTDTSALLADLQCVEEFVKSDVHCRLLVPHSVYAELEARSRGDSGARALPARRLLRKLSAQAGHIVVQSKPEYELSSEDSILHCCWSLLQEDCHVVLLSNNKNMLNKAKTIDLECYTLDDIKYSHQTSAEPQDELKKLKIIATNTTTTKNKSGNLFMQDLSDINGLCLPKPNVLEVSDSRLNIFNAEPDTGEALCKRDANSDKLINLTRPRNKVNTVFKSDITNVRDQITKLSVADSRFINIRAKQIMKNVFHNKVEQDTTTVDIENSNCNKNKRSVPKKNEIIDEIDRDIRRLNVTETNVEKSSDTITVSGITKLNNQFNLDEDLGRFCIKNAIVENRVKSRLEEWMCRLNQTMEGILTDILLKEKPKIKNIMPPWNLFEAIQLTGETFKKQPYLKTIIDRYSMQLLNCSSNIEKLNKDMKPNDFMKLVGLSMILIEHLKKKVNCKELHEADDMLVDLIKNIEDPKTDVDLSLERVDASILSRSEISDVKAPAVFKKSRTEVLEYLTKHFPAWQSHETDTSTENAVIDKTINKQAHIVRTCGKDLSTLKINNTKAITVETNQADKPDVKNQPKVIRNVKIIPAFEERLKRKAETVYSISLHDSEDKLNDRNENTNHFSDNFIQDDLPVSASSINTVCAEAYTLMKMFLVKLKSTLTKIFDFINTSTQEYKEGTCTNRRAEIMLKTELTRQYVLKITERLKNIIERESGDGKIVKDFAKTGERVEDYIILTNYKQTVTKYLEQAQILGEVLEHLLSLPNALSEKEKGSYRGSYKTSPILPARRLRSSVLQLTNGSYK